MRHASWLAIFGAALVAGVACSKMEPKAASFARDEPAPAQMAKEEAVFGGPAGSAGGGAEDKKLMAVFRAKKKGAPAAMKAALDEGGVLGALANAAPEEADGRGGGGEGEGQGPPAATRAWFPETFLFEPLVATDDAGFAKVSVRVPDRLTTWRILALAHSRDGAQAGTEASFLGTLPTYVDPVVPGFLMAGDEVSIPIQVVNTTADEVTRTLRVEATGAAISRGAGAVKIAAASSRVEYAPLRANRPGLVTLKASLGDKDAVEKSFPVLPTGRPMMENRGGTLAAPRALVIELPGDADPESTSARLQVFPGALAILRSELAGASSRGGVAGDAYALLLAGRGEALLKSLGGDADPKAMRALAIVAGQRVIRAARSPDVVSAALMTEAALSHPDNPVLSRLGERLADTVARGQRPDGTFEGGNGWTLQRLLVTTAECVRAVGVGASSSRAKQRKERAMLAAEGAFERNLERVEDAFTAAAIVASGAVKGTVAEKLRKLVREKLRPNSDGSRSLPVEEGVVRADGARPSEVEATALAVLALADDKDAKALVPDLGASLLAAYDPARGFGDGHTNLLALTAVLSLFKDPLPARVEVTLSIDERRVASGVLEGAKLKETLALEVPLSGAAGKHTYHVRAEPPVPGLGFALALKTFVPWKKEAAESGLELSIETAKDARVGQPVAMSIAAAAPSGYPLEIDAALPAGADADVVSLDALVSDGTIASYEKSEGHVLLRAAARQPGQGFTARYRVIPTLAGTLHSGASSIAAGSATYFVPPLKWVVK